MERHNEILLDDILLSMAATSSKFSKTDPVLKNRIRKNDCYSFVARTIKEYRDNDIIQNSTIRVYSLGGHLGHCIMVNKDNEIITDNFREDRVIYNKEDGSIQYKESRSGTAEMGSSYKLDSDSFSIKVKDYLKIVDSIKDIIDYKSDFKNKGKFINMLNKKTSVEKALENIKEYLTQKEKKENKKGNKIKKTI